MYEVSLRGEKVGYGALVVGGHQLVDQQKSQHVLHIIPTAALSSVCSRSSFYEFSSLAADAQAIEQGVVQVGADTEADPIDQLSLDDVDCGERCGTQICAFGVVVRDDYERGLLV